MSTIICESPEAASIAAADRLSAAITSTDAQRPITLAVSGGTTPIETYQRLSQSTHDWENISITLTDKRDVPVTHPDSNARMLKEHLLRGSATAARFQPLQNLQSVPAFGAVLLGMGADGHIASIFPDSPQLDAALDLSQPPSVLPITTPSSPHPRLTLNLSALLQTQMIIVLMFGDDKLERLQEPGTLPIHRLTAQNRVPVDIIWAA